METVSQNTPPSIPPPKRDFLVWSILSTIFCCLPFGIAAIVFSVKANSAYDAGNYMEHNKCADNAKLWLILGIVIGFIFNFGAFLCQFAAVAASGF